METDCSGFLALASEYVDGTLSDEARSACDRHVRECASCASYHETLRQGLGLLRAFAVPPLSDGFRHRLRHRLMHEADRDSLTPAALGSGSSAVALFAMSILLAVIAWTPTLLQFDGSAGLGVDLEAPVAGATARPVESVVSRPLFQPASENRAIRRVDETVPDDDFWADSRDLLFELAPISDRYRDRRGTPLGFQ